MTLWSAALLASSGAAHAYTVRECVEKWYPQAKVGQQIYELHPVKTVDCQKRDIEMKSSRFGTIDGKGYFITDSESTTYACPRVGSGVGIPTFACMLPAALQRNVVYEKREYYLLTPHGADLRPLGKSLYSTDGRTVFRFTTPINDADPATFQLLDTDGADHNLDWARDSTHIYYRDTSVPDMVPDEVRFAGPFVLNDGRVPLEKGFAFMGRISGPIAGELIDESGFVTSFPWSNLKSCSEESDIPPWPKSDDLVRLGSLRLLPDAEVPEGFAVALENERYRYLFVSRDKRNTRDMVIDLQDGRRIQADCK